jgi:hypothetical protein
MRTLFTGVWSKVNELNHSTTQVLLLIVMAFYLLTYGLLFYGHDLQFLIIFFQIEKEKEQKSKQFKKENEEKINTIQDIESCKFMSMYFFSSLTFDQTPVKRVRIRSTKVSKNQPNGCITQVRTLFLSSLGVTDIRGKNQICYIL